MSQQRFSPVFFELDPLYVVVRGYAYQMSLEMKN